MSDSADVYVCCGWCSDTELLEESYSLYGVKPPGRPSSGPPRSPFPPGAPPPLPPGGQGYDATRYYCTHSVTHTLSPACLPCIVDLPACGIKRVEGRVKGKKKRKERKEGNDKKNREKREGRIEIAVAERPTGWLADWLNACEWIRVARVSFRADPLPRKWNRGESGRRRPHWQKSLGIPLGNAEFQRKVSVERYRIVFRIHFCLQRKVSSNK